MSAPLGIRSAPGVAKSPTSFLVLHINLWLSCVISAFPHSAAEQMPGNSNDEVFRREFLLSGRNNLSKC